MISLTEEQIKENWDYSKPLVTIRCLAYNHEKYIEQCLDGFLIQKTDFPFEVVIHDDASTDNTQQIIRRYENSFPGIVKPIYETENQYSKNDGSLTKIINTHMRGKYIAICEGDDYWFDPMKLKKQFNFLEEHPQYTIAFNRVKFINVDGTPEGTIAPPIDELKNCIISLKDFTEIEYKKGHWTVHTSSFFIRRNVFLECCKRRLDDFSIFPYGDMVTVICSLMIGPGYVIPDVMGCYRVLSGGYNSYVATHPEYAISQELKLISALDFLDRITERKYSEEIKYRRYRAKVTIALTARDKKKFQSLIRDPFFKTFYKNYNFKFVITSLETLYFPYFRKIRKRIKKFIVVNR